MNAKTAFVPLLTNRQKASLCQMARQAWIEAGSALDFSDWRRQQQLKVVGKASLTQCNQDDYRPLANHFVAIKNGAEPDRKGCYSPSINIGLDSCTKLLESIATREKEKDDACAP